MTAADPTAAIASYLLDTIGSLVDGRVYRPSLPREQDTEMPRAVLVVKPAGGYGMTGGGLLPVADPRIDVIAYGATDMEAQNLGREVALALKTMPTHIRENTLLKWARISGGPFPAVDPATSWPYCFVSAQVLHAEVSV